MSSSRNKSTFSSYGFMNTAFNASIPLAYTATEVLKVAKPVVYNLLPFGVLALGLVKSATSLYQFTQLLDTNSARNGDLYSNTSVAGDMFKAIQPLSGVMLAVGACVDMMKEHDFSSLVSTSALSASYIALAFNASVDLVEALVELSTAKVEERIPACVNVLAKAFAFAGWVLTLTMGITPIGMALLAASAACTLVKVAITPADKRDAWDRGEFDYDDEALGLRTAR